MSEVNERIEALRTTLELIARGAERMSNHAASDAAAAFGELAQRARHGLGADDIAKELEGP